MYAKARRGEIKGFTGIDDPYEAPVNPELVLDTVNFSPEKCARQVIDYLVAEGLLLV
ncbi:MAG: putative bifunctional SAT/APS kinase [bacterium ADurb.Bin400]|nr:MAG: putative bifunctional SAT/APS kinase [bacterium ADurb.Bin400]